jgi:hypothetical protein
MNDLLPFTFTTMLGVDQVWNDPWGTGGTACSAFQLLTMSIRVDSLEAAGGGAPPWHVSGGSGAAWLLGTKQLSTNALELQLFQPHEGAFRSLDVVHSLSNYGDLVSLHGT